MDFASKKRQKIKSILKSSKPYSFQNNKFRFMDADRLPRTSVGGGFIGGIQEFLKKFGRLYSLLLYFLSPVQSSMAFRRTMRDMLRSNGEDRVIVNLGSGPSYLHGRKDIINVDIFAFDHVDVLSDAVDLPFEKETVDLLINVAMLEHACHPELIIKEMHRVLKRNGQFFCYVPFIVPYHAAPDDFFRWTISGCKRQFSEFSDIDVFVGSGPTSGMLWVLQEWLATFCSFGNKVIHDILLLIIMVVTAPVKLIDFLIERFPNARNIASGFCIVGKK